MRPYNSPHCLINVTTSLIATHLIQCLTSTLTFHFFCSHQTITTTTTSPPPPPLPLPAVRLLSTMADPTFILDPELQAAWDLLSETFRDEASEPSSSRNNNNNNNEAARRDDAGDEGVVTATPRSQRQSGGLPTLAERLAATSRPLPRPSHHHADIYDVPDDPPAPAPALKKRKADTTTAAAATQTPTKRRNTLAATAVAPSPKKGKNQSKTEHRRPEYEGEDWSKSETEWAALSVADRGRFSHIGRIEETDDGVKTHPGEECLSCKKKGKQCLVYSETAREKYHRAGEGFGCSACRFNNKQCSINAEMGNTHSGSKKQSKDEKIAALEEENRVLKAKVARYEQKFDQLLSSDDDDDDNEEQ
jgi:hypothetical protein